MDQTRERRGRPQPQFQFCEVCKLNHNQGRGHVYFPKHKAALRLLLTRFQSKLSDVKFFLKHPIPLRTEDSDVSRLWCVFCVSDVLELDSRFACGNAIEHLSSDEHLKRVKRFMGRHGGGFDSVDSFRVSEEDLSKWKKKCDSLAEVLRTESTGSVVGPLNNIHNELNADKINRLHENHVISLHFNVTNDVLPLPRYTNERTQISCSEISSLELSSTSKIGSSSHNPDNVAQTAGEQCLNSSAGCMDNPCSSCSFGMECYGCQSACPQVLSEPRTTMGEHISKGLTSLTRISIVSQESMKGNVHTGEAPPWFVTTQDNQFDAILKPELNNLKSLEMGKSKLNPKRVGAAWAERRKLELELEKRGELLTSNFDANWLPNFGRVWQSGTRKESRKEFKMVNQDGHSESSMPLQPYISKRMRKDAGKQ